MSGRVANQELPALIACGGRDLTIAYVCFNIQGPVGADSGDDNVSCH